MDVFELEAILGLNTDKYESGLNSAKNSAESSGSAISGVFGKIGSTIGTVAKATATAVGVVATGVGALTASAVKSYATYEQLEGGVETLFGTGGQSLEDYINTYDGSIADAKRSYESLQEAQDKVMENASNAYKTAGMSANEYMETVTSFSASLIQSLDGDTVKASEYADKAITDMSDNANKMGTDIESIENAYQGFAKQNYTMLDNLKLGYGGTKSEMERLIEDAEGLSDSFEAQRDEAGNLTMSYADIVDAIHIVQDNMGITGTTALEASTTIEGSLNQTKSAWENLITGLADSNANLDELSKNLIDSLVGYVDEEGNEVNGFIDNVIPVVETALSSIGTLVNKLVPEALKLIPTLINEFLPDLVTSAKSLITGLVSTLEANSGDVVQVISNIGTIILNTILEILPDLIDMGSSVISNFLEGISENSQNLVDGALKIVDSLVNFITSNLPLLIDVGLQIIEELATGIGQSLPTLIPEIIEVVMQIVQTLVDHLPELIEAGLTIFTGLVEGLIQAIPVIVEALPELIESIINALIEAIPLLMEASITLLMAIVEAIPEIMDALAEALPEIIDTVISFLTGEGMGDILTGAIEMFMAIAKAIPQILTSVLSGLGNIIVSVLAKLASSTGNILSGAVSMFKGIASGLAEAVSDIPSKIAEHVSNWVSAIKNKISDFKSAGQNLLEGLWNGISDKAQWVYSKITGLGSTIVSKVKSLFGINSPSKVFAEIGGYLAEGLGVGWENEIKDVNKQIEDDMDYDANLNVTSTLDNSVTASASGTTLTDQDISRIISGLQINFQNNTYIDGSKMKEEAYKYTVERTTNETRAVNVSQGGYF
jgi:phage-related protein